MPPFNTGTIYGNNGSDVSPFVDMGPAAQPFQQGGKRDIVLYNNVIPAPENFKELVTPIGDADVIWQVYWDSIALTSGAANPFNFFLNPANTNQINSNLFQQGKLQGDEQFLITALRIELECDSTSVPLDAVDTKEILRTLYFNFIVLNKSYADAKGMMFLNPEAPLVNVSSNYYQQNPFMSYRLPIQMAIGANQSFRVNGTCTAPTLSGNWRLFCYAQGALYRGIQ